MDNILERLLALPVTKAENRMNVTRIGHPARVMSDDNVLDSTLDVKAGRSDEVSEVVLTCRHRTHGYVRKAALAKDVKDELEAALGVLSGKGKGAKGKPPRGLERKKMWGEVRELRKECVIYCSLKTLLLTFLHDRYRKREGGVVENVLSDSQIVVSTCHSSGGRQLYKHSFDVVIIDEATQAMEAVSVFLYHAKGAGSSQWNLGLLDTDIQSQETDPCGRPDAITPHYSVPGQ